MEEFVILSGQDWPPTGGKNQNSRVEPCGYPGEEHYRTPTTATALRPLTRP